MANDQIIVAGTDSVSGRAYSVGLTLPQPRASERMTVHQVRSVMVQLLAELGKVQARIDWWHC
jgi:hypothetical protein